MADIFYQHQKRHPAAFYNCGMPFSYWYFCFCTLTIMYNRFRLHQFHFDPVCFFYRKLFEQFPIYTYTGTLFVFHFLFIAPYCFYFIFWRKFFLRIADTDLQLSSGKFHSKRCLSILIILLRHQCRRDHQISKISSDAKAWTGISSQRFLHSENGFLHHCTPDCRSASYYGQRFYRKNDPPEKKLYSFQTGHAMRGLYLRSH